jgi:hypothetical protein
MAQNNAARNRRVGHAFELVTAKQLSGVFPHIASSRSCNRKRDDAKVDLVNQDEYDNGRLPYNIQCKSKTGTVSYLNLLAEMPKEPGIINVIMHRYTVKQKTKETAKTPSKDMFYVKGEFGIVRMVDMVELIKAGEVLKALMQHVKKLPKDAQKQVDEEMARILTQIEA